MTHYDDAQNHIGTAAEDLTQAASDDFDDAESAALLGFAQAHATVAQAQATLAVVDAIRDLITAVSPQPTEPDEPDPRCLAKHPLGYGGDDHQCIRSRYHAPPHQITFGRTW